MSALEVGIKGQASEIVNDKNTASFLQSGSLEVYATPAMIALAEKASCLCVDSYLEDGFSTVGTKIDVEHLSATPLGIKVEAFSELIEIEGKKLTFKLEIKDEIGLIGKGIHERYLINIEKFLAKTQQKKES